MKAFALIITVSVFMLCATVVASPPMTPADQLAAAQAEVTRLQNVIASRPQIVLHPTDNLPAILTTIKSHADYLLAPGTYPLSFGIAIDNVTDTSLDLRAATFDRKLGNGSSTIVVGVNADVTIFGGVFDSDRPLRKNGQLYKFIGPAPSTNKSPWAPIVTGDATIAYDSSIKVGAGGIYVRGKATIVNPYGKNIDTLLQFAPTAHDCVVDCSGLLAGAPCASDELRGDGIYVGGGVNGVVKNFSITDSWNEHPARVDCDDPNHRTTNWHFIGGTFHNVHGGKEDFAIRNGDGITLEKCTIAHYLRAGNGRPGNVRGLVLTSCNFPDLDHAAPQADLKVGVDDVTVTNCMFADDGVMVHLTLNVPMRAILTNNHLAPIAPNVNTRELWDPYPRDAKPDVTETGTTGVIVMSTTRP